MGDFHTLQTIHGKSFHCDYAFVFGIIPAIPA